MRIDQGMTATALASYQSLGFLVLRNLVEDEELKVVCRDLPRFDEAPDPARSGYEKVFRQEFSLVETYPSVATLTRNAAVGQLAAFLGGWGSARVYLEQLLVKRPTDHATRPHQDAPFLAFDDLTSMNFWIALDDVSVTEAPLGYYPGTHRAGVVQRVHLDSDDTSKSEVDGLIAGIAAVRPTLRAGDALIHNCCTVHDAGFITGPRCRRAIAIQMVNGTATYNGGRLNSGRSMERGSRFGGPAFPQLWPSVSLS